MKRKADGYLEAWYKNSDRKLLIVKGARQVGKTKTIREFAGKHYDTINVTSASVHSTGVLISPAFWISSSFLAAGMLFAIVLIQKKRKNAQR